MEQEGENLELALDKALREFKLIDPAWAASRSGASYSFERRSFSLGFFGEPYTVSYPLGEVRRPDKSAAGGREALILLHYLVNAVGTPVQEEWVAYRDLPGARYHEPAFVADVERPLSLGLAGRLEEFRDWAAKAARFLELPGDVAAAWDVLPRVPLLVIFNERDEEFPASARVLYDVSAPDYLPTEDLEVIAELAVLRILEKTGVLGGAKE